MLKSKVNNNCFPWISRNSNGHSLIDTNFLFHYHHKLFSKSEHNQNKSAENNNNHSKHNHHDNKLNHHDSDAENNTHQNSNRASKNNKHHVITRTKITFVIFLLFLYAINLIKLYFVSIYKCMTVMTFYSQICTKRHQNK